MGVTGAGIGFLFGSTGAELWSGNWWWIPLTAVGGLIVSALRKLWKVPQEVPSPIALAHQAWVDYKQAVPWVIISAISLIAGASLGPFFGLAVMGGGFGSWLVTRVEKPEEEEARQEYTLTGMAGGMGAAFTAPLFATILASELAPTAKRNYVAAFIPELFAATVGYLIYFGVTGSTILNSYALPAYGLRLIILPISILLGILAALILVLFALIKKLVTRAFTLISNPLVAGTNGGALVGLIAFALPLTANSGNSQLAAQLQVSAKLRDRFLRSPPACQDVCRYAQPIQRLPGRRGLSHHLYWRHRRGPGEQPVSRYPHCAQCGSAARCGPGSFLKCACFADPDRGRYGGHRPRSIGSRGRRCGYGPHHHGHDTALHRAQAQAGDAGGVIWV